MCVVQSVTSPGSPGRSAPSSGGICRWSTARPVGPAAGPAGRFSRRRACLQRPPAQVARLLMEAAANGPGGSGCSWRRYTAARWRKTCCCAPRSFSMGAVRNSRAVIGCECVSECVADRDAARMQLSPSSWPRGRRPSTSRATFLAGPSTSPSRWASVKWPSTVRDCLTAS